MEENRAQAFDRLLTRLDEYDVFTPKHEKVEGILEDTMSMLSPFLHNPERHNEHVKAIIQYAVQEAAMVMVKPILRFYNFPLIRSAIQRSVSRHISRFRQRVLDAQADLKASVDPSFLDIDLLPLTTLPTKADWKKQGRRLILVETRGVIQPGSGMQVRAISHNVEIAEPAGCQFVDSTPSTEMELIGQRELSVSEKGKFVHSVSTDATLKSSLPGGGWVNLEAGTTAKESDTLEHEAAGSAKLSDSPHVDRVISSAIGSTALWRLLRTPTQNLLGSNKYAATVLVPSETIEIALTITHSAEIENWGPANTKRNYRIPVPRARAS